MVALWLTLVGFGIYGFIQLNIMVSTYHEDTDYLLGKVYHALKHDAVDRGV